MAVQFQRPAKKPSQLGKLIQVGGAVAGGLLAGPGGAMQGAATGASLGGLAGSVIDPQESQQQSAGVSAAQRRTAPPTVNIDPIDTDPNEQLAVAQQALQNLPPAQQQQFGPALTAGAAAFRRRGTA